MANRYWVGGTGTWATSARWSLTSGGTGGASVPTSTDSAIFDTGSSASVSYTVTISATAACQSLTIAGPSGTSTTVTLAGSSALSIYGSMTLPATGMVRTYTGAITFASTTTGNTISTNGVSLASSITCSGIGGAWTLGTALTTTGSVSIDAGTFNTSTFALSARALNSTSTSVRAINLGSSTVTLTNASVTNSVNFTNTSNLTFTCGTSQIVCSSVSSVGFIGGAQTFNTVTIGGTGGATSSISGANTFATLTIAPPVTDTVRVASFASNQTISGSLVASGTLPAQRVWLASSVLGTPVTITVNGTFAPVDCDFSDITIAGSIGTVTGTRLGDRKGNTAVSFTTGKTVYWNLAGSNQWSSNAWATASGGTPTANSFPLAQDTAVINNTGAATVISGGLRYAVGTLSTSTRTTAVTIGFTGMYVLGDLTVGTGVSWDVSSTITFAGRVTQTITSNGVTFNDSYLTIESYGGTVQLGDDFSNLTGAIFLNVGTFNANNRNITLYTYYDFNPNDVTATTRALNLGSGTWTILNGFTQTGGVNFTLTPGTATITFPNGGGFVGGYSNLSWPTLNSAGASVVGIYGSNTFTKISNTAFPASFTFEPGYTQTVTDFNVSGTAGNLVTLASMTPGTAFTLSKAVGVVAGKYLSISWSTATGGAKWYAGANSTDGGNNTGWLFTAAPTGTFFMLMQGC